MLEDDRFICKHCNKTIQYERPLFCPFCGEKIDPTDGLELQDNEIKIYKWSGIAPFLIWLLTIWTALLLPASWIFGKTGVAWLTIIFALASSVFMFLSWFVTR